MFYTYMHLTKDENRPFYIGKGQGRRAWHMKRRTFYWHNIVNKHGVKVQILAHWDTEQEAFEHEKFLIRCFREMGHSLVNLTDGGEGTSGRVYSEDTRRKIGEKSKGRHHVVSEETREKIRQAHLGKPKDPLHIEKMRRSKLGKSQGALSDETKRKMSEAHKAKFQDPEFRAQWGKRRVGKKHTRETKDKIRWTKAARKAEQILVQLNVSTFA